jgi:hypothetical protein
MDLLHKQFIFSPLVARLILFAYQKGYSVTLDWAYRPPEIAAQYAEEGLGIASSLHCDRLAMDLNLFQNDEFLTDSAQYIELGEFWKDLSDPRTGITCTWGGDFQKPDGRHFSIEHDGTK